ncbi:MAG: pentapeptide repeat-containing protein [Cyanobacteriota bacterium]|nr:pentapeptide repeat-containing protein [Cyanobacteriota bacterium]
MTQPRNRRQRLSFIKSRQPAPPTTSDKPGLFKKFFEPIYDKLILGVVGGLVATLITNYISRQSHFDEVVSKYTAAVKEYTVSEKLSSLRASKERLEGDIKNLDSFIKILNSDPVKLDPKKLDDYIFDRPKREVSDSEYIKYGVDLHNFSNFIACTQKSIETKCEFKNSEGELITSDDARQFLGNLLEHIRDKKQSLKKEKEEAINQINGLAQSVTVNTLITLSEDASFLGIAGWSNGAMDFIPFLRNQNLVRRDIVINTLRNSQLGFGSRYDGASKFPYFLQNITIGSYTNQGGSLINLSQADLSLAQLQNSNLTQLDLRDAVLSNSDLTGAVVSGTDLSRANFSAGILENTTFSNSTLQDAIMKGANLKGSRFRTTERGSCLKFEEDSGKKCYEGVNLKGADLSDANLTNADLTGVDLNGANLTAATLTGAKGVDLDKLKKDSTLCNTLLPDGTSYSNNCRNVDFSNPRLKDKKVFKTPLKAVDFSGSKLAGVKFDGVDFGGSPSFRNTDLTRVDFSTSMNVKATDILAQRILPLLPLDSRNNTICYTKIKSDKELKHLTNPSFFGLFASDFKNLKSDKKSYEEGEDVILTMDCSKADLSNTKDNQSLEVDFGGFDLTGIDFSEANLTNVNFKEAKLQGAKFNGANLTNADLTDATGVKTKHLSEQAVLCNTTLTDGKKSTNCKNADLSGQDLTGQSFENVDLTNANLTNANLTNANLTGATGITNDSLAKAVLCNTTLTDGKTKKSTNCKNANLSGQDLTGQSFENVDLTNANLTGAKGITLEKLKSAKATLCRTKLPDGSQDDSGCPETSG